MKTIEEYQVERREYYKKLNEDRYRTDIECPNCPGVEMRNYSPGEVFCTNPPQKTIQCPVCGHCVDVLA